MKKVTLRDANEDVDKVCIEVQKTSDNAGGKPTRGFSLYYIHLEITGDPCNLIGSERCDLFTNRTILCFKSHLFFNQ